jgi:hypothetical protein
VAALEAQQEERTYQLHTSLIRGQVLMEALVLTPSSSEYLVAAVCKAFTARVHTAGRTNLQRHRAAMSCAWELDPTVVSSRSCYCST